MPWSRAEALDDFLAKTMDRLMEPMAKEFAARLAASDPKPPATATTSPLLIRPVSSPVSSPGPDSATKPAAGSPTPAVNGSDGGDPPLSYFAPSIVAAYQRILQRPPTSTEEATWYAGFAGGGYNLIGFTAYIDSGVAQLSESGNDISQAFQDIGGRPATAAEIGMVEGWEASPSIAGSLDATRWWLANQGAGGFDGIDVTDTILGDYSDILQRAPTMPGQVQGLSELDAARFYIKDHTTAAFRVWLATGTESTADLTNNFQGVLGRPPTADELTYWQNWLGQAPGHTLGSIRGALSHWYADCANQISSAFLQVLNRPPTADDYKAWEDWLGAASGNTLGGMREFLAKWGPDCATQITDVFQAVLGRGPSATETSTWQDNIGGGQALTDLRGALANGSEAANLFSTTYTALTGGTLGGYVSDFARAFAAPTDDPTLTLQTSMGAVVTGDARHVLAELTVGVTLNSGVTPTLVTQSGTLTFATAADLTVYLFATALRAGLVDAASVATLNTTLAWLTSVNQPMLQAGEIVSQAATAANASGNTYLGALDTTAARVDFSIAATTPAGQTPSRLLVAAQQFIAAGNQAVSQQNWNLVALMNAGADICIQESRMPNLASLGPYTERVYQSNGATTVDVTVDPNSPDPFGTATYHSKDQSPSFLEALAGALLDIAAAIPGPQQVFLAAAASAYNAAQGVQSLANGQVVNGLIDLGTAAGFGAVANGDGALAGDIFAADAVVGGANGIAQSAQSGSALGIVSGALEVAAGVAGGLLGAGAISANDQQVVSNIVTGLGVASGVLGGAAAIEKGDIADGLLTSLGPLLANVTTYVSNAINPPSSELVQLAYATTDTTTDALPTIDVTATKLPNYTAIVSTLSLLNAAQPQVTIHDGQPSAPYVGVDWTINRSGIANDPYVDTVGSKLADYLKLILDTTNPDGLLSGPTYGTTVHTLFAALVREQVAQGYLPAGTEVEVSYTSQGPSEYGASGSSRADILLRDANGDPYAVFDVKTGNADLSAARIQQLSQIFDVDPSRVLVIKWGQ